MMEKVADLNNLTFDVAPVDPARPDGPVSLVPSIDGTALTALVQGFEEGKGYEPAGGYSGIVPAHFNFGDLRIYYLGRQPNQWPRPGHAWVLGCNCGEVGCWPLGVEISVTDDMVTWSKFEQPHRPDRDYTGLGPFRFHRSYYARAVQAASQTSGRSDS